MVTVKIQLKHCLIVLKTLHTYTVYVYAIHKQYAFVFVRNSQYNCESHCDCVQYKYSDAISAFHEINDYFIYFVFHISFTEFRLHGRMVYTNCE